MYGRTVTTIVTAEGTEYIVNHRVRMAPTGDKCTTCNKELWTHSDSPGQLFTLGGMWQEAPLLSPHWIDPCADGWD